MELLGLKGSKKRKGKKLDEDFIVSRSCKIFLKTLLIRATARLETTAPARRSEGGPGYAPDAEQEGSDEVADAHQGASQSAASAEQC